MTGTANNLRPGRRRFVLRLAVLLASFVPGPMASAQAALEAQSAADPAAPAERVAIPFEGFEVCSK